VLETDDPSLKGNPVTWKKNGPTTVRRQPERRLGKGGQTQVSAPLLPNQHTRVYTTGRTASRLLLRSSRP